MQSNSFFCINLAIFNLCKQLTEFKMKNFLIYTLATVTGIILASLLFFFIMIGTMGAIIAAGEKPVTLSSKNVLVLNAGVPVPDRSNPNPWAGFDFVNLTFSPAPGLYEILNNIKKAESDPKITGILIENGLLPSGWATAGEIREALLKFRESGKFVLAYSDYVLTQEGYYLSTSAGKIYVNPGAMLEFKGLSGEVMFYKDALEKLGVEVQVIRHGKFKGAVEPFILDKLSDENREQIKTYVGSIWNYVLSKISEARNIPAEKLQEIADKLDASSPAEAARYGMVDGLLYRDQLYDSLKILSGLTTDDRIGLVSMSKYTKVPGTLKQTYSKNKIALIFAEGDIVTGKGTETNIGGNHYADIIREQRKDTNVKAIVLRVNSPGGNAVASDIIWRELKLAAEKKPVIVSMGNYAASGGYYISVPATTIFANPVTITGSIGVFGLVPQAGRLLKNKLGINTETVNTNRYADFPSVYRPMTPYEKEVMQKSIENIYSDFTGRVSEGRKMDIQKVLEIAEGRVWDGSNALNRGLVDQFGGLEDAVEYAAKYAGLDKYSVNEYPVVEDPYLKLLSGFSGQLRMRLTSNRLGEAVDLITRLSEMTSVSGIYARMPYLIDIH